MARESSRGALPSKVARDQALSWRFEKTNSLMKLKLTCDLRVGWRDCRWGNCFSEQISPEVFGGQKVRIRVSVFTRPRGILSSTPVFHEIGVAQDGFSVVAVQHIVLVSTTLADGDQFDGRLPWRLTKNGKPFLLIRTRESELMSAGDDGVVDNKEQRNGGFDLEIQALLVVQGPPVRPAPVYRDWFRRFLPGGLPELGRR